MPVTDLKLNYPTIPEEQKVIGDFFSADAGGFDFLKFPDYQGIREHLDIASRWLGISDSIYPGVVDIIACNSGNHAISTILPVLRKEYESIITEPFTYPAFKLIAQKNDFTLHASEFDEEGLTVDGLERTIGRTKARLIYLQPTIHNPTCAVAPLERRKAIADLAKKKNLLIIEDDAYRFLHPDPPLRYLDLAPENTLHIFSLSKPFNPLIKTAFLIVPHFLAKPLTEAVRLNSSGHSSLLSGLAAYLLEGDVLNKIIIQKRLLATRLQQRLLTKTLGLSYKTFPTSFHIWVSLPERIRSHELIKKLGEYKIILAGGADSFVGNDSEGEQFIRIALGAERDPTKIEEALIKISALIN